MHYRKHTHVHVETLTYDYCQ